jgi:hypothetical protein
VSGLLSNRQHIIVLHPSTGASPAARSPSPPPPPCTRPQLKTVQPSRRVSNTTLPQCFTALFTSLGSNGRRPAPAQNHRLRPLTTCSCSVERCWDCIRMACSTPGNRESVGCGSCSIANNGCGVSSLEGMARWTTPSDKSFVLIRLRA